MSRPALVRMSALPKWLIPAVLGLSLFFGLAVSNPLAGLLLLATGLFLGWLTALSWPAISPASRLARIAVNVALVGLGVLKLLGRI